MLFNFFVSLQLLSIKTTTLKTINTKSCYFNSKKNYFISKVVLNIKKILFIVDHQNDAFQYLPNRLYPLYQPILV